MVATPTYRQQRKRLQRWAIVSPLALFASTVAAGRSTSIRNGLNETKPDTYTSSRRRAQQLNIFNDPKTVDNKLPETEQTDPTNQQRNPNILWLLLDQWRYDWDGLHPDSPTGPLPLHMPFLTRLAQSGTQFTQAYVPSPFCAPSRACVAAGKEYDATGVLKNLANSYPVGQTTIYTLLRDGAGYHTMTTGKDDLYQHDPAFPRYPNYESDFNTKFDVGFSDAIRTDGKVRTMKEPPATMPHRFDEPYRDYLNSLTMTTTTGEEINARAAYTACSQGKGPEGPESGCDASSFPDENYPDNFIRDKAIELLNRKPADKPWFLLVNFPGPHHPIVSTSRMAASVMDRTWPPPINAVDGESVGGIAPCPQVEFGFTKENVPPILEGRCNYAAELENLDALMASIVRRVKELGEFDNTIVFISGDHGENLGDNGFYGKGMPWTASVTTPFFIHGPGVPSGYVHPGPVTTLDVGGTFFDIAGVPIRAPGMTTTSLFSILAPERNLPHREYVSSGYDNWRLVVKEMPTSPEDPTVTSYKLICCMGKECKGAPETAMPYIRGQSWQLMLYDSMRDPLDLVPLEGKRPDVVQELVPLLPEGWCRDVSQ